MSQLQRLREHLPGQTLNATVVTSSLTSVGIIASFAFGNDSGASVGTLASVGGGTPHRVGLTFTPLGAGHWLHMMSGTNIQIGTSASRGFNLAPASRAVSFDDGTTLTVISGSANPYGNTMTIDHDGSNGRITTSVGGVKVLKVFFPQQAATASAPAYVKGGMYFDTTLNKLRIGGATAWETVTSV